MRRMIFPLAFLLAAACGGDGDSGMEPQPGAPTASFTVSSTTADVVDTLSFDASGSTDPEDAAADLEVRWDWEGDGTWDTPFSTEKTAEHQYLTGGSFTAMLEVRDTDSNTDTDSRGLTITRNVATVNVSPSTASVDNGFTQQFSASVLDGNGNAIPGASVSWSVSDADLGSISSQGLFTAGVTAPLSGQVTATSGSEPGSADVDVASATISFSTHLLSTFQGTCAVSGCHNSGTAQNNLVLESYSTLMAGDSNNGPVVTPGDAAGSVIIQKLSNNPPFGQQMPAAGSVTQAWRNQLYIWIEQGANDN